jgi:hypothetical protein
MEYYGLELQSDLTNTVALNGSQGNALLKLIRSGEETLTSERNSRSPFMV